MKIFIVQANKKISMNRREIVKLWSNFFNFNFSILLLLKSFFIVMMIMLIFYASDFIFFLEAIVNHALVLYF